MILLCLALLLLYFQFLDAIYGLIAQMVVE